MTSPVQYATALARRWAIDIDLNPGGAANWQSLIGVEELKTSFVPRREDDEAYEDAGAARQATTGYAWGLEPKLIRRTLVDGVTMDPVHEYLRTQSEKPDAMTGEIHVRYYDRSGVGEAWDGRALVTWTPDGGKGRDTISVKIDGQGPRVAITNPNSSPLPVVAALAPTGGGTAGGNIVTIKGRKFTGVTGVTFGGTAATQVTLQSDNQIACLAPAKAAGTYDVLVTTAGGTSANTAADNYTYA